MEGEDEDLYDEFGNYIGPEIDSDDDGEDGGPLVEDGDDDDEDDDEEAPPAASRVMPTAAAMAQHACTEVFSLNSTKTLPRKRFGASRRL